MTGRSPVRSLTGLCLALMLAACGGGTGVDTAAGDAAASAAEHGSGVPTPGSLSSEAGTTPAAPTVTPRAGNPGAPGADRAGDGGTDVQAQGNPGAPGDVAVFEEAGVPFSALKGDAAGKCADGVCTLLDPVVGAGNPDDVGGVDNCLIKEQSDIRYDPPAVNGFFQRGATVRATVDCTAPDSGTAATQTTDDASDTSGPTSQDQGPTDVPQG